ncbi:MAG: sigma-70 family RNA polymerase sigma factor [Flavobacteriaceae bacterium]|nr:sigma-70 family RNA polymerase sigma factor [Bacteroidia bacterium]MBT8289113.1 sigma-70 family RNA polymerase sigma factor [Bacteroidia bacterium]NNF73615.1 sigma-70 family RNA polymerase sigma factor [Flavobacteriaceae bacterium]NNK73365.1 sigma-70 family RNA polymerase sigma factor [Flavobacteriaceae bacterium]
MATKFEEHIVSLLKESDQRAMPLLYENYSDTLYGVIYKVTKDQAMAEDALQETFIKIWRFAHKYDASKAKLFTWLYRIARNTAIDKLRSHNLKFEREIQINDSNVYKIPVMSLNQDAIDLKEHVATLDTKYQIVLRALFFEGMTQQEASEELDIPLGTVKSRLKIGLRELRKIYDP